MSKKKYHIAPDVTHIAGRKLGENEKTTELSEAEAVYDLSLGRISEAPFEDKKVTKKPTPKPDKTQLDGKQPEETESTDEA